MSWGNARKTRLTRVLTKQNQCVRCIFFAHRAENAKIYYALLGFLELNNIYKLRIALFAHKIQNDKQRYSSFFSQMLLHQHLKSIVITTSMHQVKTSTE